MCIFAEFEHLHISKSPSGLLIGHFRWYPVIEAVYTSSWLCLVLQIDGWDIPLERSIEQAFPGKWHLKVGKYAFINRTF